MLNERFRKTRLLLACVTGLFVVFSYAPMISVFTLSFQGPSGGLTFPMRGLSLHWFASLFTERQLAGDFWSALQRSVGLALLVGAATLAIALTAGLAFRRRFVGANVLFHLTIASLVVPSILVGLGVGILFAQAGIPAGLFTSGLGAHLTWTVPIAVLVMFSVFARFDQRLEEAARDAGASRWLTLTNVVIPTIAPSLIGVFILAVTLSYDEFARSMLTMGTRNTLPLELFAMTTNVTTPAIYALGTVTTAASLTALVVGGGIALALRQNRQPR